VVEELELVVELDVVELDVVELDVVELDVVELDVVELDVVEAVEDVVELDVELDVVEAVEEVELDVVEDVEELVVVVEYSALYSSAPISHTDPSGRTSPVKSYAPIEAPSVAPASCRTDPALMCRFNAPVTLTKLAVVKATDRSAGFVASVVEVASFAPLLTTDPPPDDW